MMHRHALGLLLLLGTACGGSSSKGVSQASPASSSQDMDLGIQELRKSLESTVLENYLQLSYGNIEAFTDGVASDRELQLVGVTPNDVLIGINPKRLRVDRRLYQHRIHDGLRILSKNLDVHISADGSVGWIYDEVSYRIMYMGREASIPIRVTGVYVRDVERWVLVAEHASYGLAIDDLLNLQARKELVAGRRFKSSYGSAKKLTAYLIGLVGRFCNDGFSTDLAVPGDETLVLLPSSEQEFHDADALGAPTLAEIFGDEGTVSILDFRVQLAENKRIAWVMTNIAVHTVRNGDTIEVPLRASFVLERREGQEWDLIQTHVSAALSESQLSERVFGPND